jgi:cell division septum initiation protein DivIVA
MVAERYKQALEKIKRLEAENAELKLKVAALRGYSQDGDQGAGKRWPEDY